MSRQPSPGPSVPAHQTSYYRDAHGLPIEKNQHKINYRGGEQPPMSVQPQHGASGPGPVATSSSTGRSKGRVYQSGIAAGAEDVKYAAKYRDLKQKVREIEGDNDKLMFKVLQAKRSIQRAKLERAILYERLAALPASPPPGHAPLPPQAVAQQVQPGGQPLRHADPQVHGQSGHRQRSGAQSSHYRPNQQPIQPAPPPQVSPPRIRVMYHPDRDPVRPGTIPITHSQQLCTVDTPEGPITVVAGHDGRPVTTEDGHFIPAMDIVVPPAPQPSHRKRGGRVLKEVREMREREAREMREREEMERKREQVMLAGANSGHPGGLEPMRSSSGSRSHSGHMQAASPPVPPHVTVASQIIPGSSREQRERDREWEIEQEMREHAIAQRREAREEEHERSGHGHSMHRHGHSHGHRYHQQAPERAGSPPPPISTQGPSPTQASPTQSHRPHSQASHYSGQSHASYGSRHGHGHGHGHHVHSHHSHSHSHSHSASPHSPTGSNAYPMTRIHGHQRIGPGSYVMRDRERTDTTLAEAPTAVPATSQPSDEGPTNAPAASSSRVPTPPYMRPVRSETFASHGSPAGDEAVPNSGAKSEAHLSDGGSVAASSSTTPS